MKKLTVLFGLAVLFATGIAAAQSTFQALLSGATQNPINASTATGVGMVVLDAAQTQITVDLSWTGLTTPATAAHIHGPAGMGTNAAVLFPFTGVPAATSGSIPQQVFAITPTQVGYLESGLLYMNLHTSAFPGGEIRAQLLPVPEPGTTALLGLSLGGLIAWRLRRQPRTLIMDLEAT